MKRRDFIVTFGGAALANVLPAQAQQAERVYRVGWVASTSPVSELIGPNPTHPWAKAFLQAMRELGYVDGKNLAIEWRSAEGKFDRLPDIIRELLVRNVDVIVPAADVATKAAKAVTSIIPIVMAGASSPEEQGLIQGLARPGGNITGITNPNVLGKRVELLKELVPNMKRLVFLNADDNPPLSFRDMEEATRRLGLSLLVAEHTATNFANAFALIRQERPDAMHVALSPGAFVHRRSIVEFAAEGRLPASYPNRFFSVDGGLISLGPNWEEIHRRAAGYVDRILKGASPADLPVEEPSKFDLVINLGTAKVLGLTLPPSLLVSATEVIE
jgi:putative ABC transport system substrate-binding protein